MISRYEYGRPETTALPQRTRTGEARRRTSAAGGRGQAGPLSGRALRRRVRAVACGLIFLGIFSVRLLFPGLGERIDQSLLPLIDGGWDYKGALTAVGSFASQDGLQAVMALFGDAQGPEAGETVPGPAVQEAREALQTALRERYGQDAAAEDSPAETEPPAEESPAPEPTEQVPAAVTAFLESQSLFADQGQPEDARFDMPELGLACVAPVIAPVTDSFGWRVHPLDGQVKFHYGTDLGAAAGSDIGAFADGTVYAVGDSTSLGLYVILDHGNGIQTQYAHCQELLVSSGDSVTAGQTIARVGSTGAVTGAHLHLELSQDGKNLNPAFYVDFSGAEA